jgi:hypothetical protein
VSEYLVFTLIGIAFCLGVLAGHLAGDWYGWRYGVLCGYGALRWPDSPYFARARSYLDDIRKRDGLPTIEEEAASD